MFGRVSPTVMLELVEEAELSGMVLKVVINGGCCSTKLFGFELIERESLYLVVG